VVKLKAELERLLCDDDVIFMGYNINSILKKTSLFPCEMIGLEIITEKSKHIYIYICVCVCVCIYICVCVCVSRQIMLAKTAK